MAEQTSLPKLKSLRKQLRKRKGNNSLPFYYPKSRSDSVAIGYRPVYVFLRNVLRVGPVALPRKVCKNARRWLNGLVHVVPENWVGAVWKATKVAQSWVDYSTIRQRLRKKARFGRSQRIRYTDLVQDAILDFMVWVPIMTNLYRGGRAHYLYRNRYKS